MKNIFMVAVVLCMTVACQRNMVPAKSLSTTPVTTPAINKEIINASGQTIVAGHANHSILQQPSYKTWFDKSYDSYTVDSSTIAQLKSATSNTRMDIFLGSWCGDSKREVPRMLKILQQAGMDTTQIALVFVDNSASVYKQSPAHEEAGKNVHRVPTFILYNGEHETGRIVESPVTSLEKDLQTILNGASYTPNYRGVDYWINKVKTGNKKLSEAKLRELGEVIKPMCKHYGEFNSYGYVQLAAHNNNEALNVFRLNTIMYPEAAGVFDSLGEAYAKLGNKKAAVVAYEKVLSLKPGDANAIKMLSQLKD